MIARYTKTVEISKCLDLLYHPLSSHIKLIDRSHRSPHWRSLTACHYSITDHISDHLEASSVPPGGDDVGGAVQAVGGLGHDGLGLGLLSLAGADPLGLGAGLFRLRQRPLCCAAFWGCCDLFRFIRMFLWGCQPVSVLNRSLKHEDNNEKNILTRAENIFLVKVWKSVNVKSVIARYPDIISLVEKDRAENSCLR